MEASERVVEQVAERLATYARFDWNTIDSYTLGNTLVSCGDVPPGSAREEFMKLARAALGQPITKGSTG